ncbi:MAG: T9SS type A sorting domain-containing protein [Bacteroidetes bacterium]|nr:T9SS type A sorting domain-containing protein [Bacteroidota bacterium]
MKRSILLFFVVFAFLALNSIAQTWTPSESSHFGVDGFETADFFLLTPQQLDDAYRWEASGLKNMNMAWNRTLSPTGGQFRWNVIEAVQGTYDWSKPDAFVNRVQAEGLHLLVLVHPYAQWDQPTKTDMNYDKPNNMTAFKRFIAKLVERYDGDGINDMPGLLYPIKYYEIGNEPESQTFGDAPGTYNDFMETVKAARDTAKIVYPDVKIVIAGATPIYDSRGFLNQVDSFWKGALNRSNAGSYFDIFNFHFFVGEYSQDISVYVDYWKQLLSAYGLSGKEIWLTETGTYSGTASNVDGTTWPVQTTTYQAGWWIKQASYALANGVSKLFWVFYYSDQTDWRSKVAFVNIDKTTKKAAYYAHKLMADKIDAYSSALQNAYAESGQYQTSGNFKFTVAGKPVYILWDDANGNVTLTGISTASVKTTKGVPRLNGDGSVALDNSGNPTFDTATVSVTNGQATIVLSSVPIYVEEIAAPPSAPTLISPTNNSTAIATTTTLSWNASNGATSYRLQVSTDSNFSTTFFDQSNITNTSQQVTGLSYSTLYYWRVNASNDDGTSDWSSVWSFTTQGTAPAVPTLLSPADGSTNILTTLTLSWNASSGAASYHLQVSTDLNFSTTIFDQNNITNTSQQVTGLSNSTLYYWHVNATNVNGTSSYSSTWSFTTINATSVEQYDYDKPITFSLSQNYPNPFNPTTTIRYSIPEETLHALQHVVLKVYDLLGREVVVLVNEEQQAGNYVVTFHQPRRDRVSTGGTSLPSGIYFYVIRAGNFTDAKKMMLLK